VRFMVRCGMVECTPNGFPLLHMLMGLPSLVSESAKDFRTKVRTRWWTNVNASLRIESRSDFGPIGRASATQVSERGSDRGVSAVWVCLRVPSTHSSGSTPRPLNRQQIR
jgi:hypothetical protein